MLPLPTTGEKGGWVAGSRILDRIYKIIKTIKYYENMKYSFKKGKKKSTQM
jgi:hypothetical protein